MGRPENIIRRGTNEISKVRGVHLFGVFKWPGKDTICTTAGFDNPARWDSNSFFDATAPSRITIPDAFSGRYFAHATVMWFRDAAYDFTLAQRDGQGGQFGLFTAEITINGARPDPRENLRTDAVVPGAGRICQTVIWETDLAAGDFLELDLCQTVIGTDLSLQPDQDGLWVEVNFKLRRLGITA